MEKTEKIKQLLSNEFEQDLFEASHSVCFQTGRLMPHHDLYSRH